MDFDINLILVPVTLVFLLIWLVDKFALKQHRAIKTHTQQTKQAQDALPVSQSALEQALAAANISTPISHFRPDEATPDTVRKAYQAHQQNLATVASLQGNPPSQNVLVRWAYEFLPVLAVIVIVRSFLIEPFNIPSSSMVPTLYTGDFIVVNKTAYGLRLPITHTKILDTGAPERGDVAVFRYPVNEKIYFIKRVIGLPGDTVSFDNDVISINGKPVATSATEYQMPQRLTDQMLPQAINGTPLSSAARAALGREEEKYARYQTETLGAHTYKVRYVGDVHAAQAAPFLLEHSSETATSAGTKWSITVPEGQYFVMGDNRDRSEDGRFWGFVPEANLSGKATYIWMHKEPGLNLPSFGRNGSID